MGTQTRKKSIKFSFCHFSSFCQKKNIQKYKKKFLQKFFSTRNGQENTVTMSSKYVLLYFPRDFTKKKAFLSSIPCLPFLQNLQADFLDLENLSQNNVLAEFWQFQSSQNLRF